MRSGIAVICLLALVPLALNAYGSEAKRFNVILLSIDTLAADHMSVYGYFRDTTPFISRFARENVAFENAFSQAAWTLPSHASIFTGLYPVTHRLEHAQPVLKPGDAEAPHLDPKHKTLTEYLKTSGYHTMWYALMDDPHLSLKRGFERGFDEFSPLEMFSKGDVAEFAEHVKKLKSKPFFAFLHTYMTHDPYLPPPRYRNLFDPSYKRQSRLLMEKVWQMPPPKRNPPVPKFLAARVNFFSQFDMKKPADLIHFIALYDETIRAADDMVEALVESLKELGIYDETVIVLTSDHGETFGERDHWFHERPFHEELHVPLIMRIPGMEPRRLHDPVLSIDILPTLLEALGQPVPSYLEGRSLFPMISGGAPPKREEYSFAADTALWNSKWKLVLENDRPYLFDLEVDPYEHENLAGKKPEMVSKMKGALDAFLLSHSGSRPVK